MSIAALTADTQPWGEKIDTFWAYPAVSLRNIVKLIRLQGIRKLREICDAILDVFVNLFAHLNKIAL